MSNNCGDDYVDSLDDSIEALARLVATSQTVDTIEPPLGAEVHAIGGACHIALEGLLDGSSSSSQSAHCAPKESMLELHLHKENAPVLGAFRIEV